ncbi:MAG TPA: GAF domain-containing protein [Steroidobacteraceae bacterium]|nr:GAF domain-containing protein [Steroidobacteraceae bacterium]
MTAGSLTLHSIRPCLEGAVPAVIATCARDGTPNVSYISEVHYVDPAHVALSYQFFSKTRQNVLENPRATVLVIHPDTGAQYKLAAHYLRTEDSGPLFESMKAKLAGIASHAGMTGVFRLRGADVYRVEAITQLYRTDLPAPATAASSLAQVRCATARLGAASDLAQLLDRLLDAMREIFDIEHSMVLMRDPARDTLYTVASRGYPESGIGAEIRPGQGVIGTAALERTPIRISHATSEFGYGRAMREDAARHGLANSAGETIPFPGLPQSQSQVAVPILAGGELLGVLFAESAATSRFGYDEEDALVVLADHVGAVARLLRESDECPAERTDHPDAASAVSGPPVRIRHFAENDSIFVGEDYLIKGVAGAILWKLVRSFVDEGRTEHSNRELRLDPSLGLPDLSENLEARLILLQRRLEERCPSLHVEKTGRGRFRLRVDRPLSLVEVARRT